MEKKSRQKSKEHKGKLSRVKATLLTAIGLMLLALVFVLVVEPALERHTYKLLYPEQISKYSEDFTLDPYLVAAIIHCESRNRADVKSGAGAVGLMQLMPDTGEWIAGKLSIEGYTDSLLLQPNVNIRMGCWYLRFLLDRYGGDRQLALAAYNAGHGNVDKWKDDPSVYNDGKFVDVPFPETEQYLQRVQLAYEKYKALYQRAF